MNKRIYWTVMCCALFLILPIGFMGCSDDDDEYSDDYLLTIAEEDLNITLGASASSRDIELKARAIWSATVTFEGEEEWITLTNGNDTGGYNTLSFDVEANTNGTARTATITITCHTARKDITVTQAGSD